MVLCPGRPDVLAPRAHERDVLSGARGLEHVSGRHAPARFRRLDPTKRRGAAHHALVQPRTITDLDALLDEERQRPLFDTVTQPGVAFRFDPQTGYHGLLDGRRAVPVYTSQVYRPGVTAAFQAIPVGTAYIVFTDTGAVGSVVLGILVSGDLPALLGFSPSHW